VYTILITLIQPK